MQKFQGMQKETDNYRVMPIYLTLPPFLVVMGAFIALLDWMKEGMGAIVNLFGFAVMACATIAFFMMTKITHTVWTLTTIWCGAWMYYAISNEKHLAPYVMMTIICLYIAYVATKDIILEEEDEFREAMYLRYKAELQMMEPVAVSPSRTPILQMSQPPQQNIQNAAPVSFGDIEKETPDNLDHVAGLSGFAPLIELPMPPNFLFYGMGGAGKTTLAKCFHEDLRRTHAKICETAQVPMPDTKFITVLPSQLTEQAELDKLVLSIAQGDVVFIDEIHGLKTTIEESLYSVFQDHEYSLVRNGRHETIKVPRACYIGCTTLAGDVSQPLRTRMVEIELAPMSQEQLKEIQDAKYTNEGPPTSLSEYKGQRNARMILTAHLGALRAGYDKPIVIGSTDEAKEAIAARALGNPRIAKGLQFNADAWAVANAPEEANSGIMVEKSHVDAVCECLGIDNLGLAPAHRRVIKALKAKRGQPVGERALSAAARVSRTDFEKMIEPVLQQQGLIEVTPRGRKLSEYGEMVYANI